MEVNERLYTFLDSDENIIFQVRAYSHDHAVMRAQGSYTGYDVDSDTDFYSESL